MPCSGSYQLANCKSGSLHLREPCSHATNLTEAQLGVGSKQPVTRSVTHKRREEASLGPAIIRNGILVSLQI